MDETTERIAADLEIAGFAAHAQPKVMRFKHTKLVTILVDPAEAVSGSAGVQSRLVGLAQEETVNYFKAARIEFASVQESTSRTSLWSPNHLTLELSCRGGSSWQAYLFLINRLTYWLARTAR
jgi:hypothetical protein